MASIFFFLFSIAYFSKTHLVLSFTKKFYKKKLDEKEEKYLKGGDVYWMGVTFINTIVLIIMGLFADNYLWAIYSSIGWYIYFFCALFLQIIYGKFFYQ
jgi:hypothetical protein